MTAPIPSPKRILTFMAIKLPKTPSTSDVLQEYLSAGTAILLGKGIDLSGLSATQSVINAAVSFYDDCEDSIKSSATPHRRSIVARYLKSKNSLVAEGPYSDEMIVVISDGKAVLVTPDALEALTLVESTESSTYICTGSNTIEGALREAVEANPDLMAKAS